MAQPSVINYFNTRKRAAVDDIKLNNAKKVLLLENGYEAPTVTLEKVNTINLTPTSASKMTRKVIKVTPRPKKLKPITNQANIEQMFSNIKSAVSETNFLPIKSLNCDKEIQDKMITAPTKKETLTGNEPTLSQLNQKLSRSSRLAELRASIARFKQSENKLKAAENATQQIKEKIKLPVALKDFKTIELEVHLSPQKVSSPEKPYLSPKKDTSASVRKNLFACASPVKKEIISPIRESLTLPYKYRCLAEIFRSMDTISQILYNRKETITFKKLKPAVEEMLKRTFSEKHLAQIKHLYPDSYVFRHEKLRAFGVGVRKEQWELVVVPQIDQSAITSEILLERRRKLYKILIDKVKHYHGEFLATLDPPMEIPSDKLSRWHPQFDIERVPDIELAALPRLPDEEKFTTGSEVLEKARAMFNCNTRMERALEKLKQSQESSQATVKEEIAEGSILKGIPKALLEKVRQRQAAKALESMTRTTEKDKEVQLYSQLPEIARLAKSLFVTEKKSVLPLDLVIDKLCNSYRAFRNKDEMERYLRTIAKEVDGWLVFHEIRNSIFIKLAKTTDLSLVMNKLKNLAEQKAS